MRDEGLKRQTVPLGPLADPSERVPRFGLRWGPSLTLRVGIRSETHHKFDLILKPHHDNRAKRIAWE
jgi:hypothetical protein